MLWLTTCAAIALLLAVSAFIGWRRERRDGMRNEDPVERSTRPTPHLPTRKLGFSGTLDRLKAEAKRKAG